MREVLVRGSLEPPPGVKLVFVDPTPYAHHSTNDARFHLLRDWLDGERQSTRPPNDRHEGDEAKTQPNFKSGYYFFVDSTDVLVTRNPAELMVERNLSLAVGADRCVVCEGSVVLPLV